MVTSHYVVLGAPWVSQSQELRAGKRRP